MKLYLVRHGESAGNAIRIHQPNDTPLSSLGQQQAHLLSKRFKTIDIDLILSSHYTRAHETAKMIANQTKKPLVIDETLHEIRRPSSLIGKPSEDPEVIKVKQLIENNQEKNWHYEDEENIYEFIERAHEFLDDISGRGEENILAVSHGRFIAALICVVLVGKRLTPEIYNHLSSGMLISNTGISVLHRKRNRWLLETWNDNAHLGTI